MRAATGGLAASDRTMPPSMTAPSATRLNRLIVHHHAANGVRSTRETILEFPVRGWTILWQDDSRLRSVLRKYGCHPVKKKFRLPNWAMPPPGTAGVPPALRRHINGRARRPRSPGGDFAATAAPARPPPECPAPVYGTLHRPLPNSRTTPPIRTPEPPP